MKYFVAIIIIIVSSFFCMASCNKQNPATPTQNSGSTNDTTSNKMKITVGTAVFSATLNSNATETAFKEMLPLTINMDELNGNEKFHYFSTTLPTNATAGGNIQVGDLMLYGNNCLVLFYKSFSSSYSYTRLGHIDNASGLISALGAVDVTVKFELE